MACMRESRRVEEKAEPTVWPRWTTRKLKKDLRQLARRIVFGKGDDQKKERKTSNKRLLSFCVHVQVLRLVSLRPHGCRSKSHLRTETGAPLTRRVCAPTGCARAERSGRTKFHTSEGKVRAQTRDSITPRFLSDRLFFSQLMQRLEADVKECEASQVTREAGRRQLGCYHICEVPKEFSLLFTIFLFKSHLSLIIFRFHPIGFR